MKKTGSKREIPHQNRDRFPWQAAVAFRTRAIRGFVILAIVAYTLGFYACEWRPLSEAFQRPVRRFEIFPLVLLPDQIVSQWTGSHGEIALGDRIPALATAFIMLFAAFWWGSWILVGLRLENRLIRGENGPLAILIGLAVSSHLILISGLVGLYWTRWLLRFWVVVPLAVATWTLLRKLFAQRVWNPRGAGLKWFMRSSNSNATGRKDSGDASTFPDRLIFTGALIVFGTLLVLAAVLPPTDFDVREYHLQAPKEFFQIGAVTFLPHNVYANMPLGAEMHVLGAMVLLGDIWTGALAGKLILGLYAVAGAWLVSVFTSRYFGSVAGLAAAGIFITTPWVISVSAAGLVDVALAVMVFAGFVVIWETLGCSELAKRGGKFFSPSTDAKGTLELPQSAVGDVGPEGTQKLSAIFAAGLLAGGTASLKYTGLAYGAVPMAILAGRLLWRNVRDVKTLIIGIFLFVLGLGLAGGGWYLKNLVLAGNPVYPMGYALFDGHIWDAAKAARWHRVHSPPGFSPFTLAKDLLRVTLTSDWQGALVAPFAVLGAVKLRRNRLVFHTLVQVGWIFLIWWFFTHRIDRFWLPMLPFLCVLCGPGFATLGELRLRWLGRLVVLTAILWSLLVVTSGAAVYNRFLAPLAELWNDPGRIGQEHVLLNELYSRLPHDAKLLSVGEAAVFDLRMPVLYATCFDDQPWERMTKGKPPEEIRHELKIQKIAYVYVNWLEIARYRSPGNYGFTDFVQPAQFRELVKAGVLVPALMPADTPNQLFLVK
ncbi:hypothetical protein THTE_2500 [Thermogutta terrifontis]|uniref:Glycosyltransferase RgtA/B/C/D-like domain-containing protein n=1 Tax=Thermogutta terrifontis TaxID=1331910 RepID=A0A286RGP0_9BACT|nr:hypothetical protein [Thermogutta terrifontis]ASV75102.1 hypothetical protein THTE_2500 [Thermogutta terrifontis]